MTQRTRLSLHLVASHNLTTVGLEMCFDSISGGHYRTFFAEGTLEPEYLWIAHQLEIPTTFRTLLRTALPAYVPVVCTLPAKTGVAIATLHGMPEQSHTDQAGVLVSIEIVVVY
jgi:hypothetical protein